MRWPLESAVRWPLESTVRCTSMPSLLLHTCAWFEQGLAGALIKAWLALDQGLAGAPNATSVLPRVRALYFSHLLSLPMFAHPCRRQALDRGAVIAKANKIATGHNADDVAETVLLNLLRGDVAR